MNGGPIFSGCDGTFGGQWTTCARNRFRLEQFLRA